MRTEDFKQIMTIYNGQPVPELRHEQDRFRIRNKHSWDEVIQAANDAIERYEQDARRNILRKAGRIATDNARTAKAFLDLLPDGDYGSVLCGGLKIIYTVSVQLPVRPGYV